MTYRLIYHDTYKDVPLGDYPTRESAERGAKLWDFDDRSDYTIKEIQL